MSWASIVSYPYRLKTFLSVIHDTTLVAIVIPISCLKLLYFRGTWGLLIFFFFSHSHFSLWFYRCSYSRTGIPILLVYFFHYLMETRINTYLSPIGLMKILLLYWYPRWTLIYIKALKNLYLVLLWITKLEKHRLFTLTKSRAAVPNQVEFTHLGRAACQPW